MWGDGDIQCKTDGAVDFVLLVLGHVFIVAVFVVGGSNALCTVIGFVFEIVKRECTCGKMVLVGSCVARDHVATEVGVLFNVDVETTFSCENAGLISCIAMITMSFPADRDVTASIELLLYIIFIPDFSKPLISDILCKFRF